MKRILLLVAVATMFVITANAQPNMQIPADKDVRIGKLESGLTYYVRANAKPENQAEFYILHNVGAMQEEDNQQGLAHFLEHLAFNGTVNLPDKKLINWCESVGIKFGANLNASTGQERTLYNVSAAPIDRPGVIDTCLLILHEWSQFIALEGDAIDAERGVIIEEKRTRNTASWRMMEKSYQHLYGDTKYAQRNVIGTTEVLENFKHDELRDFYHRWYRPDLQAIVVVGDFDADEMVEKIKTLFADVKAVENPEPKAVIPLPKNIEPIIGIITDPEAINTTVGIYIKNDPLPKELNGTMAETVYGAVKSLMGMMANTRLREITQKPNAPFINGRIGAGRLVATSDAIMANASAREGESLTALEAMYTELEKIRRFGFTEGEFEIAKADYLKNEETAYNNRNDRRHREFIYRYVSNFIYNTAIPDAETNYNIEKTIISNLNVNIINEQIKRLITLENQIVLIEAPEKEGTYPTEAEVKAMVEKVRNAELEAYKDNVVTEPLIPEGTVLNGSPVAKTETDKFDATVWTLANGVKIVVKQTDFKADELRISIRSLDGLSNVSDDDYFTATYMSGVMQRSGIGNLNAVDLRKQLAGKSASVSVNVSDYTTIMSAGGSPSDVEAILQLIYMNFAQPRWNEDDFGVFIDNYKSQLKNMENEPNFVFWKETLKTRYNNNPRRQAVSAELMDKVSFERLPTLHKQFFGNTKNFVFIFVGNIAHDVLKPLVEKYIGSLSALPETTQWKDDGVRIVSGEVDNMFEIKMQNPKTSISYTYSGNIPYNLENGITMDALAQILRIRYTEVIREEKGATYGVRVTGTLEKEPNEGYSVVISFDSDKEKVEKLGLLDDVVNEFKQIADNGPTAEDLGKIKEFLVKQRKDDLKQNANWISYLVFWHVSDFDVTSDYDNYVEELSAEKIQKLAAKILADKNLIRVIMNDKTE